MDKKTIDSLQKTQTINKHLDELNKIFKKTEDNTLKTHIENLREQIATGINNAKAKNRNPVVNMYKNPSTIVLELYNYCLPYVQAGKEEWEVLAERNGWTRPTSKP